MATSAVAPSLCSMQCAPINFYLFATISHPSTRDSVRHTAVGYMHAQSQYPLLYPSCHIHDFPPTPPYASASPLHITSTQVRFHFHLSTFPPRYSASTCLLISLSFSLPFNAILLVQFPFGDKSYSLPLICCSVIPVISRYHYLVLTF